MVHEKQSFWEAMPLMPMHSSLISSQFGWLSILDDERDILQARFIAPPSPKEIPPPSRLAHHFECWLEDPKTLPPPFRLQGSDFQEAVWKAALTIPRGETKTYGQLALAIGITPKASRAIGQALSKNPIAVLIPCHRVVAASGKLGGFRWGQARKQALLAFEKANHHWQ
ncbi:MAG: MGMT family protein [Vampirovibrionales bacterium]|nr:MGMT family protein [Vampirovibrionales bacterium]